MTLSPAQQDYFETVWSFVRQVPAGRVVTYGQIAKALPVPPDLENSVNAVSGARLVGSAMAACPADVPWHRVINAQGGVSSRADAANHIRLLEAEGLSFVQGRIDLNEYQWFGPDQAESPKQHQLF